MEKVLRPQIPRLLFVGNFLSSVGENRGVIEDLAEKLRNSARASICVSPYRSGWIRGVHIVLTAVLRRWGYDLAVVDLYSGRAFVWGEALSFLLAALRCPFVLVLHGGGLPDFAKRYPQRVKACLTKATVVTTPSRYLIEQMRPYRADLRLLPNPLNLNAYRYKLRRQPQPDLVWLRAFHEIYNPSLAVKAGELLAAEFPAVRLTMIGPDKGDGSLQRLLQLARERHLIDRVILPGKISKGEVPNWMDKGDIFLNTTNVDNTPISVLEAMACGLCVVSTNVGGIPYLLEHEYDALLVPPDNPEAMATAVRRFLIEPGLAERISRNARQKAEQFDWSCILPQWEALLTFVAKNGTLL
jgi:glycosyltransferase involved in cell wall biosynthesis